MNLTLRWQKIRTEKTISLAIELQDPVIKIEFWNRKRELQTSAYSEKVIHRELSNQTQREERDVQSRQ